MIIRYDLTSPKNSKNKYITRYGKQNEHLVNIVWQKQYGTRNKLKRKKRRKKCWEKCESQQWRAARHGLQE